MTRPDAPFHETPVANLLPASGQRTSALASSLSRDAKAVKGGFSASGSDRYQRSEVAFGKNSDWVATTRKLLCLDVFAALFFAREPGNVLIANNEEVSFLGNAFAHGKADCRSEHRRFSAREVQASCENKRRTKERPIRTWRPSLFRHRHNRFLNPGLPICKRESRMFGGEQNDLGACSGVFAGVVMLKRNPEDFGNVFQAVTRTAKIIWPCPPCNSGAIHPSGLRWGDSKLFACSEGRDAIKRGMADNRRTFQRCYEGRQSVAEFLRTGDRRGTNAVNAAVDGVKLDFRVYQPCLRSEDRAVSDFCHADLANARLVCVRGFIIQCKKVHLKSFVTDQRQVDAILSERGKSSSAARAFLSSFRAGRPAHPGLCSFPTLAGRVGWMGRAFGCGGLTWAV